MIFAAPDVSLQVALAVLAVGLGYGVRVFLEHRALARRRALAETRLADARRDAKHALDASLTEAREHAVRVRESGQVDLDDYRETIREFDQRLDERAADVEARDEALRERRAQSDANRRELRTLEYRIRESRRHVVAQRDAQREKLLELTDQTEDLAIERFLGGLDDDVSREMARFLERRVDNWAEEADLRAREVVDRVTQRMDLNHAREDRSFAVSVDSGALEKWAFAPGSAAWTAFEEAAGVELKRDDENDAVQVSCLDGVRREVARRALECVLGLATVEKFDGTSASRGSRRRNGSSARAKGGSRRRKRASSRAQPATRIEPDEYPALIERLATDLDRSLARAGKRAMQALKLRARDDALYAYLGRLQYRTSYGQNILKHSQEVGNLGGLIGAEGGFDTTLARRCSFLHDVGKCIDHEVEGGHPEIGANIAHECGEDEVVVNAIAAHHDDVPRTSLYPLVVQAADAISGARPGARRRTAEKYMMRMGQIEEIAAGQPGVEGVYVIQAGREVRVILDAKKTTDGDADTVARSIARDLEQAVQFPGTIRVTVVRERRISAVAH